MFAYDSHAASKAQSRQFRNRLELSDSPFIRDIEAAGARIGVRNRASASPAIRDYIWRKQCALVRYWLARDSWRSIANYGRELPLAMVKGAAA